MCRRFWIRCAVVLIALIPDGTHRAQAGPSLQVPVGARAIAMGGAFSAVADDGTTIYWNAAGLPWIGHQEITGGYANLYGSDIRDNFVSFTLPLTPNQAAAVDWYHSGYNDTELDFGENRIDLAYGRKFGSRVSAGAVLKYLDRNTALDGSEVRRGSGWGADFGVLAQPVASLRLAALAQDAFDTRLHYGDGGESSVAFPRTWRVGAAFTPRPWGTLAVDGDDRLHVGAELRPVDMVALRAGYQSDLGGPEETTWSFGAGVRWSIFRFDYAYEEHPVLGGTSHFGLSLGFNFNPSQIRIEKVEAGDLYSSLYRSYAREPFGTVRVKNLEDSPVTAQLHVFVPDLMQEASEQEVVLRPHATQDLPLTAVFPDRILDRAGDRPVQVQVSATYQSLRLPRTEKASARCVAYGPGAIDWSRGVDQAGAFVTTRDPLVAAVARDAVHALDPALSSGNRNIDFTAAVVDAVAALGVTYVPDPNNPYASMSGTARAVDTILYPAETLTRRAGDCDDTTVLLAALLGNIGIRTQFVAVPGHIFLLVSTDVHERNRFALRLPEDRYAVADGEVWIPLETTALSRGFLEAWREGAAAYADWDARGRVERVDVNTAQTRYEPAIPYGSFPPLSVDASELRASLTTDLKGLEAERAAYMADRFGGVQDAGTPSPEALNEIAFVYYRTGRLGEARTSLDEALGLDPGSARTRNNLGAVYAAEGDLTRAAEEFLAASEAENTDPGVWLNLGLVLYSTGDSAAAAGPLTRGLDLSGGYPGACALLGLRPEADAVREGTRRMTDEEARALLQAALRAVPAPTADSTGAAPPDSLSGPGNVSVPWTGRVAGARGADRMDLASVLYWKP